MFPLREVVTKTKPNGIKAHPYSCVCFATLGKLLIVMIGTIVAGVAAAGGALLNASAQRKAAREKKRALERQKAAQDAWYKRNYYRDYLNTVEAQNAIKRVQKAWDEKTQEARARQAITGGTPEQTQAVAEVGGEAMGELVGNLAAQGEQNKQAIDTQKMEMDAKMANAEAEMAAQQEAARANLVNNVISTGTSIMSGMEPGKEKAPVMSPVEIDSDAIISRMSPGERAKVEQVKKVNY